MKNIELDGEMSSPPLKLSVKDLLKKKMREEE